MRINKLIIHYKRKLFNIAFLPIEHFFNTNEWYQIGSLNNVLSSYRLKEFTK